MLLSKHRLVRQTLVDTQCNPVLSYSPWAERGLSEALARWGGRLRGRLAVSLVVSCSTPSTTSQVIGNRRTSITSFWGTTDLRQFSTVTWLKQCEIRWDHTGIAWQRTTWQLTWDALWMVSGDIDIMQGVEPVMLAQSESGFFSFKSWKEKVRWKKERNWRVHTPYMRLKWYKSKHNNIPCFIITCYNEFTHWLWAWNNNIWKKFHLSHPMIKTVRYLCSTVCCHTWNRWYSNCFTKQHFLSQLLFDRDRCVDRTLACVSEGGGGWTDT